MPVRRQRNDLLPLRRISTKNLFLFTQIHLIRYTQKSPKTKPTSLYRKHRRLTDRLKRHDSTADCRNKPVAVRQVYRTSIGFEFATNRKTYISTSLECVLYSPIKELIKRPKTPHRIPHLVHINFKNVSYSVSGIVFEETMPSMQDLTKNQWKNIKLTLCNVLIPTSNTPALASSSPTAPSAGFERLYWLSFVCVQASQ